MTTEYEVKGGWTELKGKVKEAWGQISDDELRQLEGNADQLVGLIQRSTGESREAVEQRLRELDARFRPYLESAYDSVREYAENAAANASEQMDRLRHNFAEGHVEAQEMVKSRPLESVAVAFGAGIIAGVVVGLVARTK